MNDHSSNANTGDFQSSAQYLFVRSRQLEGTFPGDAATGTWPITVLRVSYGWGAPPEEAWPYNGDASSWPPVEPPKIDEIAKRYRGGRYQRVRTAHEAKVVLAIEKAPVMVSLEITEGWFDAPSGRILVSPPGDKAAGVHTVLLTGYDDERQEFDFRNSWGADWGDHGCGHISYDAFENTWIEGWTGGVENWYLDSPKVSPIPEIPPGLKNPVIDRRWAVKEHGGGIFHAREFLRAGDKEPIGWSFAVERGALLEIEELFVRPSFRKRGYGRRLIRSMEEIADEHGADLKIWIPFPDASPADLQVIQKLIAPVGLSLAPSNVRWAACGASAGGRGVLGDKELREFASPSSSRPRSSLADRGERTCSVAEASLRR